MKRLNALSKSTLWGALAILLLVAYGAFTYISSSLKEQSAEFALSQAQLAIQSKNERLFTKYVHVEKLADNIVTQMLAGETEKAEASQEKAPSLMDQIGGKMGAKIAAFVHPELVKSLKVQMVEYVKTGAFKDTLSLATLHQDEPMLKSLYRQLGGDNLTFTGLQNIQETDTTAQADIGFVRKDLEQKGALTLQLIKQEGVWQVIALPNLKQTIYALEKARLANLEKVNAKIRHQIEAALITTSAQKAAGTSEWGIGKSILIQLGFENTSKKPIQSFKATLRFRGEDKALLREVTLSDTDPLAPGNVVEKSWPMSVNPLSETDKIIYTSPNVMMDVSIEEIVFDDGTRLKEQTP